MTSEQLSIKLRLDLSDVTQGVKKVKAQLSGMADKVKQSIPKINSESKKATNSLNDVAKAGNKVKKTIDGIGDEAKDSIGVAVKQSNKLKQIFDSIGNSGNKAKSGLSLNGITDDTDEATNSLEEMQSTIEGIASFSFAAVLLKPFENLSKKIKPNIKELKALKQSLAKLKEISEKAKDGHYEQFGDFSDVTDRVKNKIKDLRKQVVSHLAVIGKNVGAVILKFTALASVIGVVVTAVNAFKVSQLGKEIYTASQQAGFSVQSFQEWTYVLERTGVEADELKEIMKTLSESQVDVIDGNKDMISAYNKLGLSAKQVASMNQEQLWNTTIKALQNVENTTERTAIAYKIFSEDTAKLTTVLNLTNSETQELISTYNELGGAMSKQLITNSNVLQGSLVNLRAAWQGLRNTLAQWVLPAIIAVVEWLTKAMVVVNTFLQTVFNLDMTPMTENLTTGMNSASGAIGGVGSAAESAEKAIEKLKRTTMGFDELNIVTNPNTAESDSNTANGSTGTTGSGIAGMGNGESIFMKASKEAEEFKKKVEAFVEKWETQIKIIGGLLAGLGVTYLVESLGKAIGLCDGFLDKINVIKSIATSAITIVLQYSFVNEFMDNYIDGEGIKEYIKSLIASAIGTGILWATWGATGLVIGLGVTAVASIKAVIDNGGVDSVESAVVALTGLAAAIGSVVGAIKIFNNTKFAGNLGAFVNLLKETGDIGGALAVTFPKLAGIFSSIGTALGGVVTKVGAVVSGLSTGAILGIAAIIAAIASAVYFLYENWDKVVVAVKNFFNENIVPKLENIKIKWGELKQALDEANTAFMNAIPPSVREAIENITDTVKNAIDSFKEWAQSKEWLKELGAIIEGLGGIIVGVVGGVILGAINAVVGVIEGLATTVTGVVKVISGAVEAIVKLCQGDLQGVVTAWEKISNGVQDIVDGLYEATIGIIVNWVEGIIDWCTELWDELVGHSIIPDMIEDIIDWFWKLPKEVFKAIEDFVSGIIDKCKNLWTDITKWFSANVAPKFTKQYWSNKFDTIRSAASEKMDATKTAIQNIWNNISKWFNTNIKPKFTVKYWTDKFDTIKQGARAAFNGIISVVENAVNGIIRNINTLSWKIPDWVPKWGGQQFGFNFRQVYIPRLAEGGIAQRSTIANIGENGKEAILPLENNTGWMDILADKIASRYGTQDVVLKVGETELGRATIRAINKNTKENGGLQLCLA